MKAVIPLPRKTKIYLDTSAISHLEQPEKPTEQAYTQEMFDRIKRGAFDVCLSDIVFDEIRNCRPPKLEKFIQHVSEIDFTDIPITDDVEELAEKIIAKKILPPASVEDSEHIAAAIIAKCDYIVSWNMKHMANVRVNKGVRIITLEEGYKEIMLVPPSMLLEGGFYNEARP